MTQEEYFEQEYPKFKKFYKEHIEGKSFDEIDPKAWEWYSDWHKDLFGCRP